MIIDIDDKTSVLSVINYLTADWFGVADLYAQIKTDGKTVSSNFWNIASIMLDTIANYLEMPPDDFRDEWNRRCSIKELKIMGYHCTRQGDQNVFLHKGILPLSHDIIGAFFSEIATLLNIPSLTMKELTKLTENIAKDRMWKYRSGEGTGPYFFISYKEAKSPNNDFHKSGSEIWWLCIDHLLRYCHENNIDTACSDRIVLRRIISDRLLPFIIHCEIPYSMIPFKDNCAFYMLRAFFAFIDPQDDFEDFFSGNSIDLKGQTLEPKYISQIEEV
jgi:hypothetical protein